MSALPTSAARFLVYFPALATFYRTDDLLVAETIVAAHWGIYGEVSERGGGIVLAFAEHDTAAINAARRALDAMRGAYQ